MRMILLIFIKMSQITRIKKIRRILVQQWIEKEL